MSFDLDTLMEWQIPIPTPVQTAAWQASQSGTRSPWNHYLNQLCLNTFLPWLQEDDDAPESMPADSDVTRQTVWEFVNGTVLNLDTKRVVLIPDRSIDEREFRVPQEWVDIPDWIGDYYLAMQVDLDENMLRLRGYTTHQYLKTQGRYDPVDRTYCLDAEALIADLNVLWVMQQLPAIEPTQSSVSAFQPLNASLAEQLLARLSQASGLELRLELPFEQWAMLIAHPGWRQHLYQQVVSQESNVLTPPIVNLGQWLTHQFEESWLGLERLFAQSENLALGFRQAAMTDLAPGAVQRAKRIPFPDQNLVLILIVEPEADHRLAVRIQVRSLHSSDCLPPGLTLALLSDEQETIQSVQSRSDDNLIQLKRFRCPEGTQFAVQVTITEFQFIEQFGV
jgi:Protein of unknown function (DUF1822)